MASSRYKGQAAINMAIGEVVFPACHNPPHDPEQYRFEKIIGRRTPSGVFKLKKLRPKHKNVIALHLRGLSNRDVAFVTGLHEQYIGDILGDPLSHEVIQAYLSGIDHELAALAPKAVDALRSGLDSDNNSIKLQAADRFFKVTGKYAQAESTGETAEDVLARALARVASENAASLREVTRQPPMHQIEGRSRPAGKLAESSGEQSEPVEEGKGGIERGENDDWRIDEKRS